MKKIAIVIALMFFFSMSFSFSQENLTKGMVGVAPAWNINDADYTDWPDNFSLVMACRFYFQPQGLGFNSGVGVFFNLNFVDSMEWREDDGTVNIITSEGSRYIGSTDAAVGPCFGYQFTENFSIFADIGFLISLRTTNFDIGYSLLYGDMELRYTSFDLGVAVTPGLQYRFGGMFFVEAGANLGFTFTNRSSFSYYSKTFEKTIEGYGDDGTQIEVNRFRITPYLMAGIRF